MTSCRNTNYEESVEMDIFRTLLCAGLVYFLWNFRLRNIRPIRDFVLWGMRYPFHFILMGLLILVIWGLVGADFGMQGLFLDEGPLIQVLAGASVMLLFSALILHYSVLDSPGRWWNNSLKTLIRVLHDLNDLMAPTYPVQRILRNGFLERFEPTDIDAIHRSIHSDRSDDTDRESIPPVLKDMLCSEPFRLLVSPAILLIKGFMLVLLVGAVPTIVPLLNLDYQGFIERLPWLAGVILGQVLGIVLACRTTQWAAHAADWERFEEDFLRSLREMNVTSARMAEDTTTDLENPRTGRPHGAEGGKPQARSRGWSWETFLLLFFVVHVVVNLGLPQKLTHYWIDWPEQTYISVPPGEDFPRTEASRWESIPWIPIGVLMAEASLAAAILITSRIVSRRCRSERAQTLWRRIGAAAKNAAGRGLWWSSPRHRAGRLLLLVGLTLLVSLAITGTGLSLRVGTTELGEGLWGLAFLTAFLLCWLVSFRLATWGNTRGTGAGSALRLALGVILVLLILLYLAGAGDLLVSGLAAAAVIACLAAMIPVEVRFRPTGPRTQLVVTTVLLAVSGASILAAWRMNVVSVLAGFWIGTSVIVLGAWTLAELGRRRPALLYPLTLLLGFIGFAIPYNALDERWQSAMPSAGSVTCMVALIAAVYTIISFLRPKRTFIAVMLVVAALVLLNGNAWFVAPNEFKSTFPNMESYYALPVYLDSRDYFRDTTPTTVRAAQQGRDQRL